MKRADPDVDLPESGMPFDSSGKYPDVVEPSTATIVLTCTTVSHHSSPPLGLVLKK